MSIRQLEYFVTVASEGSFTRAAERLFVTQPALSHQIRQLELALGGRLLERLPRNVRLTPLGRAVLEDASLAVGAAERVRRTAAQVAAGGAGDLEIATVLSVAAGVLPKALRAWSDRRPGIVTKLHEFRHKSSLEGAVAGGLGDIAIGPRPGGRWLGALVSLGVEEFVVVLPRDDPLAGSRERLDLRELAPRRWVLYNPEHGLSEVVATACARAGFSPRGVVHTWQVEVAARLAASGLGPAMLPDNAVPPGLDAAVLRLRVPMMRELAIYARGDFQPLARDFADVAMASDLRLQSLPAGAVIDPTHALVWPATG